MKKITTVLSFIISAAMIAIGVMMSQNADVLHKAIRICLECVGIG